MYIPIILVVGVLYFAFRLLVKSHVLLNLYKAEIDSSGALIHNISLKVIGLLIFYQLCIMIKIIGQKQFVVAGVLAVMLAFTIIVFGLYMHRGLIRLDLFVDQNYNIDKSFIRQWKNLYKHPVDDILNSKTGFLGKGDFNNGEFKLKSKIEYLDEDLNRLNIAVDRNE